MDSDSCTITVIPTPEVDLPDALWLMTGEPISLSCYSGPLQYHWSTGETSQCITVMKPGIYWVAVSDNFCVGRDTVEVVEIPAIFVPNAFTPNGDDLNDEFGPQSDDAPAIKFWVFSRWGDLVFESSEMNRAWDGNFRGEPASCDVYTWVMEWDYTYLTHESNPMTMRGKKQGMVVLLR